MYTHVYNLTHDFHDVVKTDKTLNDTEWQLITTTQFYIKLFQKFKNVIFILGRVCKHLLDVRNGLC